MCNLESHAHNKRRSILIACATALLAACVALAGCAGSAGSPSSASPNADNSNSGANQTVEVILPTNVVNMAHQDVDDLVSDLKTAGAGHFESIEWNGTEGVDHAILVTLKESDRAWWVAKSEELVADVCEKFEAMGKDLGQSGYHIQPSATYDEVDYYYNLEADPSTQIAPYFYACEYYCVMRQLFASDETGKYSMHSSIYNSDTGKLVTDSYTSDEIVSSGLSYTTEDWERSYA